MPLVEEDTESTQENIKPSRLELKHSVITISNTNVCNFLCIVTCHMHENV